MTAQPGDRSFLVSMMQGAFLLVTVAAFVPYWIYGLPSNIERVKGPLAVWWGVLVLYWIGAYVCCGVHLAVRAKFRRAAISTGDIREASYINAVAIGNAIWIFFTVAGTGGLIGSSFVPFLLITPALAILFQASRTNEILWIGTTSFVFLALLAHPWVSSWVRSMLGGLDWILSFRGSEIAGAYTWSVILTSVPGIWSLYLQRDILPREGQDASASA